MSTAAMPQACWSQAADELMVPAAYEVAAWVPETDDCAMLRLRPLAAPLPGPRPSQSMTLYAFGVGEVATSLSGLRSAATACWCTRSATSAWSAACCTGPGPAPRPGCASRLAPAASLNRWLAMTW